MLDVQGGILKNRQNHVMLIQNWIPSTENLQQVGLGPRGTWAKYITTKNIAEFPRLEKITLKSIIDIRRGYVKFFRLVVSCEDIRKAKFMKSRWRFQNIKSVHPYFRKWFNLTNMSRTRNGFRFFGIFLKLFNHRVSCSWGKHWRRFPLVIDVIWLSGSSST